MKGKKKGLLSAALIICVLLCAGCGAPAKGYTLQDQTIKQTLDGGGTVDIIYPQLDQMQEEQKQQQCNERLKEGALQQLCGDSPAVSVEGLYLYEAHHNTASFEGERTLCVTYSGTVRYQQSADPINLFYVTILDMEEQMVYSSDDLIVDWELLRQAFLEENFVLDRSYEMVSASLESLGRETLWEPEEKPQVYFTETGLGISISVPHALGDYAEYTAPYQQVAEALNSANPCVREVLERMQ